MTTLKIRSESTEHSKQNNKDLTPGWGGQFVPVKRGQGLWLLQINGILIFQNGIVAQTSKSQNHSNCNEILQFWMVKN
jgi:hypothetical protein